MDKKEASLLFTLLTLAFIFLCLTSLGDFFLFRVATGALAFVTAGVVYNGKITLSILIWIAIGIMHFFLAAALL